MSGGTLVAAKNYFEGSLAGFAATVAGSAVFKGGSAEPGHAVERMIIDIAVARSRTSGIASTTVPRRRSRIPRSRATSAATLARSRSATGAPSMILAVMAGC